MNTLYSQLGRNHLFPQPINSVAKIVSPDSHIDIGHMLKEVSSSDSYRKGRRKIIKLTNTPRSL